MTSAGMSTSPVRFNFRPNCHITQEWLDAKAVAEAERDAALGEDVVDEGVDAHAKIAQPGEYVTFQTPRGRVTARKPEARSSRSKAAKLPTRKKRPVGFTKDGRLRVGSHSTPGRWYEMEVSKWGQLVCGPRGDESQGQPNEACMSAIYKGHCAHVVVGAEFLETHPCFSEEQARFWEATWRDRYRRAYRMTHEGGGIGKGSPKAPLGSSVASVLTSGTNGQG